MRGNKTNGVGGEVQEENGGENGRPSCSGDGLFPARANADSELLIRWKIQRPNVVANRLTPGAQPQEDICWLSFCL